MSSEFGLRLPGIGRKRTRHTRFWLMFFVFLAGATCRMTTDPACTALTGFMSHTSKAIVRHVVLKCWYVGLKHDALLSIHILVSVSRLVLLKLALSGQVSV